MVTPSIFVAIPSYRDWELPKTFCDAKIRASGTTRINFGVHNCQKVEDKIDMTCCSDRLTGIKIYDSIAPEHIGLQMSRYIANSFYADEDYYLQIDAHMRFVPNWDERLIAMYKSRQLQGVSKPLITMYPPEYWYDEEGVEVRREHQKFHPTRISFTEKPQQFTDSFIPSQTAVHMDEDCVYTSSVSGGFIFTDGSFAQITPNKKIAFWGEEILIAARAFTHGFDLVTATEDIVYHLYASGQSFEKIRRHHVWNDFPAVWHTLDFNSKAEVERIFSQNVIGDGALGSMRSLAEYGEFAGLDFAGRKVTQLW